MYWEKIKLSDNFIERISSNSDVFCILPFVHMYIHSSEKPKVCCTFEQHELNDTIEEKLDLSKIWSSDYYKSIRQDILENKKIKGCSRCYNSERNNGSSDRVTYNKRYKELINDGYVENLVLDVDYGTQFKTPLDLDLRPGNLCNLQCRMCGPSSSSQINKEFKKMPKTFGFEPFNENFQSSWADRKNLDFILQNINKGRRIKFLGGEPTLMPEVFDIMDILIETGNTDVELAFTSNLTNVNKKFLDAIEKFDIVDINISMDGVGKTLEYIRHPIKWEQIQKNIITYSKIKGVASKTNRFSVQFTMQAYNIHNILDTLHWMKKINESGELGDKKLNFSPEVLYYPSFFKYNMLPLTYREKHLTKILKNAILKEDFASYHQKTSQRLEIMLEDKSELDPEPFIKHTVWYDLSRKQHMKDYLPELWEIFKDDYMNIKRKVVRDISGTV